MGCGSSKQDAAAIKQLSLKEPETENENNNNDVIGKIPEETPNEELISQSVETTQIPNQLDVATNANDNKKDVQSTEGLLSSHVATAEHLSPSNPQTETSGRLSIGNMIPLAPRGRTVSIVTDDGYDDLEGTDRQVEEDIVKIYTAMKSLSTFSNDLITILVPTHTTYRQILCRKFQEKYQEDLLKAVKRSTTGNLGRFLVHLLMDVPTFIAYFMRQYVEERQYVLIAELLTASNPCDVFMAKDNYIKVFDVSFEEEVRTSLDETVAKSLRDVMIPLCSLQRKNTTELLNTECIESEAEKLNRSSNDIADVLILKPYSRATLAAIFNSYKLKYYLDITDSIDIEFNDVTKQVLITVVRISEDSSSYFASELHKAVKKEDERRILNILVATQSNLVKIIQLYEESTKQSFVESIKNIVSSECEDAILLFIRKHAFVKT